jgi:acetyl-CoA carboxylase biotin carboxyl carrier protein
MGREIGRTGNGLWKRNLTASDTMIDPSKLRDLVKLMVENDLTELDLQDEKETVTIRRGAQGGVVNHSPVYYGGGGGGGAPGYALTPAPAAAPASAPAGGAAPAPKAADTDAGLIAIESPMVGTFYSAANPDSPAFASPGTKINASTVVCLIEAMKVFNEIKAEKTGTIEKVLVKNGDAVEFGQKLFLVRP